MLVGAHRGAFNDQPSLDENSLSAFKRAIEFKCDYVEFDVHKTIDGKFIIHHDESLIFENKKLILKDSLWSEIENYSLPITNEKIPLLEDAINICSNKIKMNIEIKDPLIGSEVVQYVVSLGLTTNDFFISSFHQSVLQDIADLNKGIYLGYLFLGKPWSIKNAKLAIKLACKSINPYYKFLHKRVLSYASKNNLEVHTWTVNGKSLEKIMKMDSVTSIITNDVLDALEIRDKLYG